eukprot:GHVS01089286.1.p1 GENE.GHVS01089286.1~~GHVS01089286.1.p1  ORF type:complete len:127 (+),score=19.48 GHVS01089286.1:77-457(+)
MSSADLKKSIAEIMANRLRRKNDMAKKMPAQLAAQDMRKDMAETDVFKANLEQSRQTMAEIKEILDQLRKTMAEIRTIIRAKEEAEMRPAPKKMPAQLAAQDMTEAMKKAAKEEAERKKKNPGGTS